MSMDNHALSISTGNFLPTLNKAGKVTATSEKRSILLNGLDQSGIVSLALHGKGAMAKQAAMALGGDSLESLLCSESALTGAQIATLRAHLVGAWGEASFNRASMKGLSGMVAFMETVRLVLVHRVAVAETVKAQDNAMKRLELCDAQVVQVQALIALRDAAIAAASNVVAVPDATADTATADTATADTATA